MKTHTLKYKDINLEIKFKLHGEFHAATNDQPAEIPEIEIFKILIEDTNIVDLFSELQLEDITDQLYDLRYDWI